MIIHDPLRFIAKERYENNCDPVKERYFIVKGFLLPGRTHDEGNLYRGTTSVKVSFLPDGPMMKETFISEDDFIQLSALQHYVFCPRQCALIHVEDAWRENVFTVRGNILHEKVDTDTYESRGTLKTIRGLRIHSRRLGIVGRADVVEFRRSKNKSADPDVLPVEFKSGKPKEDLSDKVQLCAQALCLEEMLNVRITSGAFFYGRIRRRIQIEMDTELRAETERIVNEVHKIVSSQIVPPAIYMDKCRRCSLLDICQPKAMDTTKLKRYMKGLYAQ